MEHTPRLLFLPPHNFPPALPPAILIAPPITVSAPKFPPAPEVLITPPPPEEKARLAKEEARLAVETETRRREAVRTAKALALRNPDKRLDYAAACDALAAFCHASGQLAEAERLYCDALDIYRALAQTKPVTFGPCVARTCRQLGRILSGSDRLSAAEWFYRDALQTWRKLSDRGADVETGELAALCHDLAVLLTDSGRTPETERFFRIAANTRRGLARLNPADYAADLAETCFYYGVFVLHEKASLIESKTLFQEALKLYECDPVCAEDAERVRKVIKRYFPQE